MSESAPAEKLGGEQQARLVSPPNEPAIFALPISPDDEERDALGISGVTPPQRLHHRVVSEDAGQHGTRIDSSEPLMSPPPGSGISEGTFIDSNPTSPWSARMAKQPSFHSQVSFDLSASRTNSKSQLRHVDSSADLLEDEQTRGLAPPNRTLSRLKQRRRLAWITISTIVLGVFSSLLSGLFLGVAFYAPHYGHAISASPGSISPSTAAFITTLLAKAVEVTFITSVLAVIGQELSRRAYGKSKWTGVSLAEVSMKTWIVQPGSMISRYESIRYAGLTLLGAASLIAAFCAILYTPAATALVQPQLKVTDWRDRSLAVGVKSSFANIVYIKQSCKTPISTLYDWEYEGDSCVAVQQAAAGYHNFYTYMGQFTGLNLTTIDKSTRPNGTALVFENIVVNASWIDSSNIISTHNKTGLVVNNVTLAAPHPGVALAAKDKMNDIIQPEELDGLGSYEIHAGVPSPALNVLCVTLSTHNLRPFVYELWPNVTKPVNLTIWPTQVGKADKYLNGTDLDSIFEWGKEYGEMAIPPLFPKLPIDYNLMANFTTFVSYGRDSIYLLGKAGPKDSNNETDFGTDEDYSMCRLRAFQTSKCSTVYKAASGANLLSAYCEDPEDVMAYSNFKKNDALSNSSTDGSLDWPNVAFAWGTSTSLNQGVFDANASIARILTQTILRKPQLQPNLPSFAESVAVLAVDTLLTSAIDAPVVDYWNLTQEPPNILPIPNNQTFPARVRIQEYASGGSFTYHRAFFPVLLITFLLNILALLYFAWHGHWLVDLTEPATLFGLAVAAPAVERTGYGGSGAEEEVENRRNWSSARYTRDYTTPWSVREDATGVTIEKTTRTSPIPLSGIRQRMGSRFSSTRNSIAKTVDRFHFSPVKEEPTERI